MNLNYFADQFVFYHLKKINYGYLQIIHSNGKEYSFGDNKSNLKVKIKINLYIIYIIYFLKIYEKNHHFYCFVYIYF